MPPAMMGTASVEVNARVAGSRSTLPGSMPYCQASLSFETFLTLICASGE